jgi:hypothetical protein
VRWARDNDSVATVVTDEKSDTLEAAVRRLAADGEYCLQLARNALEVGEQFFSHAAAHALFRRALLSGACGGPAATAKRVATRSTT